MNVIMYVSVFAVDSRVPKSTETYILKYLQMVLVVMQILGNNFERVILKQ